MVQRFRQHPALFPRRHRPAQQRGAAGGGMRLPALREQAGQHRQRIRLRPAGQHRADRLRPGGCEAQLRHAPFRHAEREGDGAGAGRAHARSGPRQR
ncbi:hypothetical protein CKO45_03020 [Paracraurococcus ruber]|uniref:Uncharacterized protein n=1 Tax=Paracraurococcus ruber TaxID=77675 RepID=A0ABS1CS87_9PROT|nr:hypothetical protein [Paracraurococcus ruber]